jgi:hypothetical protein
MKLHIAVGTLVVCASADFLWQGLRRGGKFHANWPWKPIGRDRPIEYWSQAALYLGFVTLGALMVAHDLWGSWSLL